MIADAMGLLWDRLSEATSTLGPFDTPEEGADANRHVLRLLSAALDLHVERADPARPLPTVWMSETRKFLGDSPDTTYTTIPVSHEHTYRVTVDPGRALYVGAVVYRRTEADGPVEIVSSIVDAEMRRHGGHYVFAAGPEISPDARTDLHLDEGSFWLMVRHYFADPHAPRGALVEVQRTDGVAADRPPDAEALTAGITSAADWVLAQIRADAVLDGLMRYPEGSDIAPGAPPDVPPELVSLFFPTPDISYQGCRAVLRPDQRLEVSFLPPECRFWSVVVSTPWLESLEQRLIPASINSERCQADEDGRVTIVVSEFDPGVANWIPLRGYQRVQIAYRVLLAESEPLEARFSLASAADS